MGWSPRWVGGSRVVAAMIAASLVASTTACTGDPSAGEPAKTVIVGVDLPFQGAAAQTSEQVWNALQLYLHEHGGRAGRYAVALKRYDNSTAQRQTWDEATCVANADAHLATADEVAVLGLPNAGCAKVAVPVLGKDSATAMLVVSHATSDPGLTKAWRPGEPDRYAPAGRRVFARVVATDDAQGSAAADFAARQRHVRRCLVLNNGDDDSAGLAKAFAAQARTLGVEIVAERGWDRAQPSYRDLFSAYSGNAMDCVYLAGNFDDNGVQLINDKAAVLGDNAGVTLLASEGFVGYPAMAGLPTAQGAYLTTMGLSGPTLATVGGPAQKLRAAYQKTYGTAMDASAASYAVLALQVVLAGISASDGTRAGVLGTVLGGPGVTVPADASMVGKAVHVDAATGDVDTQDVTVITIRDNREVAAG